MRTHHCNELRPDNNGQTVTLIGWVNSARDHGGVIFIDLRDREGLTQCVFRPDESAASAELSHSLRTEDVVQVTGRIEPRPEIDGRSTVNPDLPTGEIEVAATDLVIVNKAEVLPFQLEKELSNEDLRLRHRFLDLRRPRLTRNLRIRHLVTKAARDYLDTSGYIEVETPILSKSTPEGARDFLVPSRMHPGSFYALPQAPQQYKQLLMVAGVERYFQIARCFRDEDLRADRQPEFTQVDIESSFTDPEQIIELVEGCLAAMFEAGRGLEISTPFERMTWHDAMDRFGSDKPERRFDMEIADLSGLFAESGFKVFSGAVKNGGVVKAINAKGFSRITTGQVDKLTEIAVNHGARGLAYIQVRGEDPGTWRSPITKFFSEEELTGLKDELQVEEGDLILFAADKWQAACEILGRIRLECASMQGLLEGKENEFDFLWVTEFPLLAYDEEEGRWSAVHHPFTRPVDADRAKLESGEYEGLRAQAYDVVLNGHELGGGSIRIHEADLQATMFKALGISEEEARAEFGHILDAFQFGAPPHGGIALGLDRIVMLIAGEQSIREVIAFPKNNKGTDLMTSSPAPAASDQLRDLRIKSTVQEQKSQQDSAS
ncbi:MAG: aspartate--tRNA ligase [Roseibacillus sp.]|jgi:aspartyl-tRNA synthetase|nr:aspartate--tRNA ligase [Roseibacillus sp.]MBP36617.1 aspartate--tRNA ligase [Roseibacillus sp.]MCP4729437.1 aspartate--tRNA ligase [Roseibacillus sp.]MDP7106895.1 aspartate--tRNA ligase [Roseibacillus sp.]MDP7309311.1 aspartate--tRNA ligase [Roseibacillus sp.]|tara:strand:- start:3980 stop:5794 length:1815 start_codon:yes stop_codon:yes gene_type:complete